MAEYDVDTRTMHRAAFTMLKSSASIDKSIQKSFKTNVKSAPIVLSGADSFDGQSITSSEIYTKITATAHKPAAIKDPHFIKTKSSKYDEINRRCWEVFNNYALNPAGDIPFDGCEFGIPMERLSAAMHSLYLDGLLKDITAISDLINFRNTQSILSWIDFRDLVFDTIKYDKRTAAAALTSEKSTLTVEVQLPGWCGGFIGGKQCGSIDK